MKSNFGLAKLKAVAVNIFFAADRFMENIVFDVDICVAINIVCDVDTCVAINIVCAADRSLEKYSNIG